MNRSLSMERCDTELFTHVLLTRKKRITTESKKL